MVRSILSHQIRQTWIVLLVVVKGGIRLEEAKIKERWAGWHGQQGLLMAATSLPSNNQGCLYSYNVGSAKGKMFASVNQCPWKCPIWSARTDPYFLDMGYQDEGWYQEKGSWSICYYISRERKRDWLTSLEMSFFD